MNDDPQRPGSRWPGFFVGLVGLPVVVFVLLMAGIADVVGGEGGVVLGGLVVLGSIVLVTRPDPFQRGLGAGMLVAIALTPIILIGLCFAMLDSL
jgi:hypothetical protein